MASMLDACRANQGLPAKLTAGSRVGYDLSKVGAGASRGFSGKKKLEAAPWSGTWPAPGATLDLDFANDRGFVRGVGQGGVMDAITFTRASNGTFVGPDGLLQTFDAHIPQGNNLLNFPQTYEASEWDKSNVAVVPNAGTAPNGSLSASLIYPTSTGSLRQLRRAVSIRLNGDHTLSFYAKASGFSVIALLLTGGVASVESGAFFDLSAGTVGTNGYSAFNETITNVGDGWYRCSISLTSNNLNRLPTLNICDANNNFTATENGTNGVLVWGAQLEAGTAATDYIPTTSNINVPRFDWASTEQVAQRNLFTNTNTFTGWSTDGNVTTTIGAPAPDSTPTAASLIPTTTNAPHKFGLNVTNPAGAQPCVFSVYAKANGYNFLALNEAAQTGTFSAIINLSNGTGGTATTAITDVGGGWYRIAWFTNFYNNAIHAWRAVVLPVNGVNPHSYGWAADGTSGVLIAWPQVQLGASLTDYVPVGAQAPTNTPLRPAPTCNGLLIEEARTNRLLWCRDVTQTQWVKTDITAAKDQTGIDGVSNAASSLTATADGGTCIQTITLASGSRTGSVYLKRLTGTGTVQVSLDGSTWSTVELSDTEWRRIVLSGTVTNPVVGVRLAVSGDAVAMDYGQVEDGTFATSPILTTGASSTRAQDFSDILSNAWISGTPGVIYSATVLRGVYTSSNLNGFEINNGTQQNLFGDSLGINLSNTAGTQYKCIAASNFVRGDFLNIRNGVRRNFPTSIGNPALYNRATIGRGYQFYTMTGTIRRIVYLPRYTSESTALEGVESL